MKVLWDAFHLNVASTLSRSMRVPEDLNSTRLLPGRGSRAVALEGQSDASKIIGFLTMQEVSR